jgi:putative glutamine amidotransferase
VLLPPLQGDQLLRSIYDRLDGILLSGGEDVAPDRYGEAVHDKCGHIDPERDVAELALTRWAIRDRKPLLAICRGIQVLNVAMGGSLYQDIEAQVPGALRHPWYPDHPRDLRAHPVSVTPGSRLAHILGDGTVPVNSLHHQAIKAVAPGLVVVARAPDQIVEAVEYPEHPFAVGVQWHPEELAPTDPGARRLFGALVSNARRP